MQTLPPLPQFAAGNSPPERASAIWHPSPNCGERRGGARPDLIVIHFTAMASATAALHRLCQPAAEVSAHYLIDARGMLVQMVPEALRAWHAGAGAWGPVRDVNSRSIGIELANDGRSPFPEPQMRALVDLIAGIRARWHIPPARVIGHSDMAPGRKVDPGPRFDWRRLARQGQAVWPDVAAVSAPGAAPPVAEARFAAACTAVGYPADVAPDVCLAAFRLRFRPWARGALDAQDVAVAEAVARAFPVDRGAPTA
ncbi:N-acetylmuramoyl-L-alanine amidase [Mesobaculum littorinae]|uniref:N-acetylmuramoyl-L-alanine amidase n=1 Tax=Mesobaculum littorinae TaxID=2486419 RepID=A0A438AE33_9RHOB|nr:N-acetylmuramoyl-L-alanine amidase [Mesobaculum littorinae]RVV96918.1 N-acetylmuramoyl-L-alanine amidase [Mesobaculum littorinae]